jgi:predicted phage-related endonuclease
MTLHYLPKKEDVTFLLIENYRDIDRQIKALSKDKEEIGKELKTGYFLRETDYVHNGRLIATYRPMLITRFNQTLLKENDQIIYEKYLEIKEERRFLLK